LVDGLVDALPASAAHKGEDKMARTANTKLDTRAARARLKPRAKPYNTSIAPRRTLGYIKPTVGAGRWIAIEELGRNPVNGAPILRRNKLGIADDVAPADGSEVLNFAQAFGAAAAWQPAETSRRARGEVTVREAINSHIDAKRASDGDAAADDKEGRLRLHVLCEDEDGKPLPGTSGLGERKIASLTLTELREWRDALVAGRSRKTVNRIIADFRAALNHAYADEKNGIPSDSAWRKLEGFKKEKGERGREDHFSEAEALRAIEAAREIDPAFGNLCEATFHTGARAPGELAALQVRHFNAQRATIAIPDGKTGPRITTLTSEGVEFFKRVSRGKGPRDILLPRADGSAWGKSQQHRPIKAALKAAKLPKSASMYTFRHTYISLAIERGMPLPLIAENVGTSVKMIEETYFHMIAEKRREMVERTAPRLYAVSKVAA
jgi:integrase